MVVALNMTAYAKLSVLSELSRSGIPICLFELSGLSMSLWSTLLIGRDSFLLLVDMFEVFKVSFRILKVLYFESSLFLSQNALSLFVYPPI